MRGLTFSGKQFHDSIILRKGEVLDHKTSLTPPLFIKVLVPSQESERSLYLLLNIAFASVSTIFGLDFGQGGFFCFHLKMSGL